MAMMAPAAASQIAPRECSQRIETSWHTQVLVEGLEAAVGANKAGHFNRLRRRFGSRQGARLHHPWQSLGRGVRNDFARRVLPLAPCVHRTEPDAMLH